MNRRLKTVFFVIVITLVFTGIAYAQTGDEKTASTVVSVLAPLAAAAQGKQKYLQFGRENEGVEVAKYNINFYKIKLIAEAGDDPVLFFSHD